MFDALCISTKIMHEGFREHEPITISEPIFNVNNSTFVMPSCGIAGNHRLVGARDALPHLVFAHVVPAADMV